MEKVLAQRMCERHTVSPHTQPALYIYSIRIKGIARSCMFNFWFSITREIICPGAKSILRERVVNLQKRVRDMEAFSKKRVRDMVVYGKKCVQEGEGVPKKLPPTPP